ncbi:Retinol dehydrogenase 5 [Mortierella alpina]|nr:Retinol dehydrogenase 5 [Mortierella alpina]
MTLTNPANLVVVITGCDTGFGSEITEELYQRGGFTVYATCLTEQAVKKYNARQTSRIRAVQVDITNQKDVDRLRAQVEAECPQGVFCVFNNAGIGASGFIDFTSEELYQRVMDINYMGAVRITKGLLPSLRAYAKSRHSPQGKHLPRARLLTITSIAGRTNAPSLGAYSASKHATESIMDTLRVELAPWEIDVAMLEPYFAKTPIINLAVSALERVWKASDYKVQQMYGPTFQAGFMKRAKTSNDRAMPSKWVVDAAVNAIRKKNGASKARIIVGFWWVGTLIRLQEASPTWVVDFITKIVLRLTGVWPSDPFLIKEGKSD